MSIKENYESICNTLQDEVLLVAVTKTRTIEEIKELYELGHRDFGENRIQEMVEKAKLLPDDIRWHMIGNVQENKIKHMADFVYLVHGVDKAKRLKEIQKQALRNNRVQKVLLQVKIADEDSKFGMEINEAKEIMNSENLDKYKNVEVIGLMGMATFTDDMEQVQNEFKELNNLYKTLKSEFPQLKTLSMGMSGDYKIAIKEGSNLIRVGSAIFGERSYA